MRIVNLVTLDSDPGWELHANCLQPTASALRATSHQGRATASDTEGTEKTARSPARPSRAARVTNHERRLCHR